MTGSSRQSSRMVARAALFATLVIGGAAALVRRCFSSYSVTVGPLVTWLGL